MSDHPVRAIVLVGYSMAWQQALAGHDPAGRYVFIEEPDVVRKRALSRQLEAAGRRSS